MSEDMEYTYEFLRKCHGLRFKAERNGNDIEGIIKVEKDGIALFYGEDTLDNFDYFHRECGVRLVSATGFDWRGVSDFEIVPRDPETYKDWQVGDRIIEDSICRSVIFRCGEVVLFRHSNGNCCGGPYTCEELYNLGYRLVLTDIEKQIIEEQEKAERKPHEFREYDPVLVRDKDGQKWNLYAFEKYIEGKKCPYVCKGGVGWRQCIPYNEETKHLLGTTGYYEEGER